MTSDVKKIKQQVIIHAGCTSKSILYLKCWHRKCVKNYSKPYSWFNGNCQVLLKNISIDKNAQHVEASIGSGVYGAKYEIRIVHR